MRTPTIGVQSKIDGAITYESDTYREISASEDELEIDVFDISYPPGDVRRYGADSLGMLDSLAAFQTATDTGHPVHIPEGTFYLSGAVTATQKTVWTGEGERSIIRCDGDALFVTNGSGSRVDNLYLENVSVPWLVLRDPSNWSAEPLIAQSNGDGYQPTVNDSDIWLSELNDAQRNQLIGPRLVFDGSPYASTTITDIEISRIYGRFVRIELFGASRSVVRDCCIRAGKSFAGGITFWNSDRPAGRFNRAINNHVRFSSNSGIVFSNNADGLAQGNTIELCGESGIKTWQGAGSSCVNMTIANNKSNRNYYDGLDTASRFPLDDTQTTGHLVTGNECFGNGGTGINADGLKNSYTGNRFWNNRTYGFWGICSDSLIEGNYCFNNNTSASPTWHEMLIGGVDNICTGNRIWMDNGGISYAIYAENRNLFANNFASGGLFFFGNRPGSYAGNIDTGTGISTLQSFSLQIANESGTIKHFFFTPVALGLGSHQSRVLNASATSVATHTGDDATISMSGGGKIGSADTNIFWVDTPNQVPSDAQLIVSVTYNNCGTALTCQPVINSININGDTRYRLGFKFFNAASGAAYALTGFPLNTGVQVTFLGMLA